VTVLHVHIFDVRGDDILSQRIKQIIDQIGRVVGSTQTRNEINWVEIDLNPGRFHLFNYPPDRLRRIESRGGMAFECDGNAMYLTRSTDFTQALYETRLCRLYKIIGVRPPGS